MPIGHAHIRVTMELRTTIPLQKCRSPGVSHRSLAARTGPDLIQLCQRLGLEGHGRRAQIHAQLFAFQLDGALGQDAEALLRCESRAASGRPRRSRDSGEIGDDAFYSLENELDWMEESDPLRGANAEDVATRSSA
jgi:hypothetical protein